MASDVATAADSTTSDTGTPYQSLAELREAHLALKRSIGDFELSNDRQAAAVQQIRAFLSRARKTGAFLRTAKDRRPAQVILDYWSAELSASPEASGSNFEPVMLDRFEREPTAPPSEASPPSKEEQREFLSLSNLARQWQASQQQEGYLLAGDAIQQAKKFAGRDPNLDKFVAASEEAVRRAAEAAREARERARLVQFFTGLIAFVVPIAVLGGIVGFLWWQSKALPETTKQLIRDFKVIPTAGAPQTPEEQRKAKEIQRKAQENGFWWLSFYQRWSPPYEVSNPLLDFADINLPNLKLNAPNFSRTPFRSVKFKPDAVLPGASFSGSTIEKNSDFSGADLTLGQFREATIVSTSFVGTTLYRAVFDRALLCDVDFSGADLRGASFWAVSIDAKTDEKLRNTAWWLATGWGADDVRRLLASPAKPPIETTGFRKEMQRVKSSLSATQAGSFERALVLHDAAWTLAIWGVTAGAQPYDSCPTDNNDPKNALDAVERAICIVANKEQYSGYQSSFQDTKAYILMQNRKMSEAAALYRKPEMQSSLDDGEVLFRSAIAQYALAGDEMAKKQAMQSIETAVVVKNYLPSHELKHLRDYIPSELWEQTGILTKSIDSQWPSTPPRFCP
jgi:hypothetical protein